MNQLLGKISRFATHVLWWYMVLPLSSVFAAAKPLNLDASLDPQVAPMPSMTSLFLRLMFSLLFIVGVTYLAMRLLKKNMKVLTSAANIKVLDQYAFSINKGLYITQIADKVFVLGVTDHNINMITEITDPDLIAEIAATAREKEMEPILPPGLMERILPGKFKQDSSGGETFNKHIQKQIKKLQLLVDNRGGVSRRDDDNEQ